MPDSLPPQPSALWPPITGSRKIFVIGTGRSGTHWLGHILQSHPDIHVTLETQPTFGWSTEMALHPERRPTLLPRLVQEYEMQHAAVAPRHYADKNHPNIWHAEHLARRLPDAVFIGIQRNPFATVASMLDHAGVLAWHQRWQEFPVPNRFLGITLDNMADYTTLPPAAKCALRWRSHAARMAELRPLLGPRLLVVQYEDLVLATAQEVFRIGDYLQLASSLPLPPVKAESLGRWRDRLSADDMEHVASITETDPDDAPKHG